VGVRRLAVAQRLLPAGATLNLEPGGAGLRPGPGAVLGCDASPGDRMADTVRCPETPFPSAPGTHGAMRPGRSGTR